MNVIENFSLLSEQEQKAFAETLVKTINSEKTFIDTEFKVDAVEAYDMTGGLIIELSHEGTIDVRRDAYWQCSDSDEAYDTPEDPEYDEYFLVNDAKKVFKTLSTELDGYKITLDVGDADSEEIVEVEVDDVSHNDSGIGSYEYWGFRGYDSHPFCEVTGTLVEACTIYCALIVEAADTIPEITEED